MPDYSIVLVHSARRELEALPDERREIEHLLMFGAFCIMSGMTQAVARILGEVDRLSEPERRELRRALVERVPMSEDLTDEDFAALAAESFRALDEEEDAPRA